jgi:iron complex outermembrane receptor protein
MNNSISLRFLLLLVFISCEINAQRNQIIGKVIDDKSGQSVPFATVSVFSLKDSLLGGALSSENGAFTVDRLPAGSSKIKISFIGYQAVWQQINFPGGASVKDVGNIRIKPDPAQLDEIEIEAEKSTLTLGIDRRVYTVDKDLSTRGAMAIDAMKNIPGLLVGPDNSLTLRNQSPTVFVDGRPTMMNLDQIPADDIERIEIITNPSAKYVADATGGIVNVVMKKNLNPGYFGSVTGGLGTNSRTTINGNLSIREKKLSLQLSGGYNTSGNTNNGTSSRKNFLDGIVLDGYRQDNQNQTQRGGYNLRFQTDYKTSIRSLLSASISYTDNLINVRENQAYNFYDALDTPLNKGNRENQQEVTWASYTAGLNFRKTFPKQGKEFTADLSLTGSRNSNLADYRTTDDAFGDQPALQLQQINEGKRGAQLWAAQFDYVNPLSSDAYIEWGGRAAYKYSFSDYKVSYIDLLNNLVTADTGLSDAVRIDDFVGAAYFNFAGKWKGIGYQAGLRYEHTYFEGRVINSGEVFSYIYPKSLKEADKVLFPALYLSKRWGEKHETQLNFSRKIGRPGWMQLIPFIMFADRQSVQIGNPVLGPEFINLAEWNYSFNGEKFSTLSSIYGRQTLYSITNVVYPLESNPEVVVSTYANGRNKSDLGLENTLKGTLSAMFEGSLNANVFYTRTDLEQNGVEFRNEGWSWNAKAALTCKFHSKLSVQLNGNYEAPRIIPQGRVSEIWSLDASVNVNFSKKLSLNGTIADIFNTKTFGTIYTTPTFEQRTIRRWESRHARVMLTWKFGEPDVSVFRRRSSGRRTPGSGGSEMQEM